MKLTGRFYATAAVAALAAGAVLTEDMVAAAQTLTDEIIVTARKREENLQDVPISVTALTSQALQQQGITSIREVAELIPGLTFQESFGRRDDRPGLRGLTSIGDPSFGVESGVSIFIDGVYIAGDSSTFGLRDIERVEVVRGPQSALYGRNSYAGAINFVTKAPGDEFAGTVTGRAARYGEFEASATVSGPLVPGLKGSLYGRYYTYDGQYTNSFNDSDDVGDEETISIAGALFADPNDRVSLRARVAYSEDDDGHIPFTMELANTDFAGDGINPQAGDDYFVGTLPGAENDIVGPLNEDLLFVSGMERETLILTARGDFDLGRGFTATLLGGYYDEDRQTGSDSAPLGTLNSGFSLLPFSDQQLQSFSVEARVDSPRDQRIRGGLGFFYFDEERDNLTVSYENLGSFVDVGPRPASVEEGLALDPADPARLGFGENDRDTTNWAVFGEVIIDLIDQVTLTGEFRYAEDEKSIVGFNNDEPGVEQFPAKATFNSFNPRVILEFKPTDDHLIYASVAKGNKPGGFNDNSNRDPQPILTLFGGDQEPTFDEETAWTYEAGVKTTWADGRLRINASGFYSDVEDAQLTQTYSWCIGFPSPFCFFVPGGEFRAGANIINIPEVRVIGGELEVAAALSEYIDL
ncbi:MAG: TonB-dependent receptor, partial [Pseudomonadota bacterium]